METIRTKIKKWGNSLGIILPKEIINKEKLKEGSNLRVTIQSEKPMTVGKLMDLSRKIGLPKKLKKSTEQLMKEVDFELYGIKR